jgi:hypothetical protein
MSSVGFTSLSPIGSAGAAPLPKLPGGATGGAFGPQPVIRRPAVGPTPATTQASPVAAPAAPTAATPSAPAAPARAATGVGGGGAATAAAAAAAAAVDALTSGYSTTVDGKQYAASVVESGGGYTASISSVPGATATGTSEQAAENNLTLRIDALV